MEDFPKVCINDVLGDAGDEVAELHVDVAGVFRPGVDPAQQAGQAGGEAGQAVSQPGLVAAVDGLTDPVHPQPGVHGLQRPPYHAGHHSLAVLPHQPREAGHLPQPVQPGLLHDAIVGGELPHQPGAASQSQPGQVATVRAQAGAGAGEGDVRA